MQAFKLLRRVPKRALIGGVGIVALLVVLVAVSAARAAAGL